MTYTSLLNYWKCTEDDNECPSENNPEGGLTVKVKYTELPHCEVKGFCDKLSSTPMISTPIENIDCEACRADMPVHTAEVLDFCANDKGAYAILLRNDGRIVALPLRHAEMYLDQPKTRENGGLDS